MEIEANLARLEARAEAGTTSFVQWDRMLKVARERVQNARLRDVLQQARPEGCTCLGIGRAVAFTEAWDCYIAGYCQCPEGIALKADEDRAEAERLERDSHSFWMRSGVPAHFDDCSFETYPGKVPDVVRDWHPGKGGLYIHGKFGSGKTGLAVSALRAHIFRQGRAGYFATVPNLLDAIRDGYGEKREDGMPTLIDRVRNVEVLVLDDIGAERPTDWVVEKLFTIINHRHDECLATIFTSNYEIGDLAERIGERTAWRIVEMCKVVLLKGPNLRAKQ